MIGLEVLICFGLLISLPQPAPVDQKVIQYSSFSPPNSTWPILVFGLLLYLPNVLEELICVDTFATFEAFATFEHAVESVVVAILPTQQEVADRCTCFNDC